MYTHICTQEYKYIIISYTTVTAVIFIQAPTAEEIIFNTTPVVR
jgi:hypothetical protein